MSDSARDAASKRVFDSIKTKILGLSIALLGIGAVALALMALKRQGFTCDNSPTVRRGVGFLTRLRGMDITAWTHGDAWDTAGAALTLQTIAPNVAARNQPPDTSECRWPGMCGIPVGDSGPSSDSVMAMIQRHGFALV